MFLGLHQQKAVSLTLFFARVVLTSAKNMKEFGLLLIGMAAVLHGQVALYVQNGQSMALVLDVRESSPVENTPMIEKDGKLVPASTRSYALMPVSEFAPVFISVSDLLVKNTFIKIMQNGQELNDDFTFNAKFESSYALEQVFMVLELNSEKAGKMILLREIGALARHEPRTLSLTLPLTLGLGQGHYRLHLFVKGREVLNSLMPPGEREEILNKMVARRIEGAKDGPPQPFIDPAPEYPEALFKAQVTGSVVVRMHIDARGRVQNPQIVKASNPAFGASALEAVQMWRFLPSIRNGQPTEIVAEMPFSFSP
jgi:TonB family protein